MADRDIVSTPPLATIGRGITVQRPIGQAAPPSVGPFGGLSVGAGHLQGVGGVMHVAIHHSDGSTLVATLGAAALIEVADKFNAAALQLLRGEHDHPETRQ